VKAKKKQGNNHPSAGKIAELNIKRLLQKETEIISIINTETVNLLSAQWLVSGHCPGRFETGPKTAHPVTLKSR
jgi:hypothetical protein